MFKGDTATLSGLPPLAKREREVDISRSLPRLKDKTRRKAAVGTEQKKKRPSQGSRPNPFGKRDFIDEGEERKKPKGERRHKQEKS